MGYTKVSDRQKAAGGVLMVTCLLLLLGCQEDSNEPEPTIDRPIPQAIHTEEPQDQLQEALQPVGVPDSQVPDETVPPVVSPRGFTDQLVFPAYAASDEPEQRSAAKQAFDMVYVKGDPEKGIKPFYLSKTEVRLEMFYPWAMGEGMGWSGGEVHKRLGFYPSVYFGFYWGDNLPYDKRYPALAMSRTVSELYCITLRDLTGRAYRLPTEQEWEHALELGGGLPESIEQLRRSAHLLDEDAIWEEPPFKPLPRKVGTLKPDALGLYDMIGNAAEWVTQTGDERIVRGGHYGLDPEIMTRDWRAVEDISVWQETYPQLPVPTGLYNDFPYSGIRLACDADQAPEAPASPDSPAP